MMRRYAYLLLLVLALAGVSLVSRAQAQQQNGAWGLGATLPFHPADIQRDHPIFWGMQHWWLVTPPLAGGNVWYDLIGQAHGTLLNLTSPYGFRPTSRDGWAGQMQFQGNQPPDYAYTQILTSGTSGISTGTMPFSGCLWARVTAVPTTYGYVLGAYLAGPERGIRLAWRSSNLLDFVIADDAGVTISLQTTATVSLNAWHHLCMTYTGSQTPSGMAIYVDGVQVATTISGNTGTPTAMTARPWVMGGQGDASANGLIAGAEDSVMVWNRALSATEVAFLAREVLATSALIQAPQPAAALVSSGVVPVRRKITIE